MSGTPAMRLTMLANLKGKFHFYIVILMIRYQ